MTVIVDPTNENIALVDGTVAFAVRTGHVANPFAPAVKEIEGWPVIGYGTISLEEA